MNDILGFFDEYRFLSNFWLAEVHLDGVAYPSTEHAYQAAKTLNPAERRQIRSAPRPADAKKYGQKITLRPDWERIKIDVMRDLVREKFSVHQDLKEKLLATGDAYLEETNTWNDTFWGVCRGKGTNHLGKILMQVREELLAAQI